MTTKRKTKECMNPSCKRDAYLVYENASREFYECIDCGFTWSEPKV